MADAEIDTASAAPGSEALVAQMAMNAPHGAASEAYLRKHGTLLDLQIENLKKLDAYETSHLRWRRFNDQMKGLLQMMAAAVAALIVVAIAAAVWSAHQADGVVIEAFSVPPDLAAGGLSGQVVAAQLQDRLAALQSATFSYRAPSSYANDWGSDIKVQIPDTGVSIGELNRYLRNWLGHETHITGEIWRTPNGIAVAARASASVGPVIAGREADLDKLIQKAAEAVYRSTQPYRYATYLIGIGRVAEARTVLLGLIRTGSRDERAWAHVGLANALSATIGESEDEAREYARAAAEQRGFTLAYFDLAGTLQDLGHDETALAAVRMAAADGAGKGGVAVNPYYAESYVLSVNSHLAQALGDYTKALDLNRQIEAMDDRDTWEYAFLSDLTACANLHDAACVRATWSKFSSLGTVNRTSPTELSRLSALAEAQIELEQWSAAAKTLASVMAGVDRLGAQYAQSRIRLVVPLLSIVDAHMGDVAKARALAATTPLDCEPCLFARAEIERVAGNKSGAVTWFARADAYAPSLPFVDTDWGAMLLDKGDLDGAIAKFASAHAKGPHFSDPLEMWGEALIAKNRSDLALAKFEEANKYAPNWGRLHLKWGEALWWSGKREDAKQQFAIAARLELTPSEKSEFARMETAHG